MVEKKKMNTDAQQKIILLKSGEVYFVKDASKDYHCEHGFITAQDLTKSHAQTSKGVQVTILEPTTADLFTKLKRQAQIILPKDAGIILAYSMVGKESVVVDAGSGSGALSCFLAHYVKRVYSFDIRAEHVETAKKNAEFLELTNIEFGVCDITKEIPEVKKDTVDLMTLDMPEPHLCLETASQVLKCGAYLICYIPCTNQVERLVIALMASDQFCYTQTLEIMAREWHVTQKAIRPKTQGVLHTGFLVFARRL